MVVEGYEILEDEKLVGWWKILVSLYESYLSYQDVKIIVGIEELLIIINMCKLRWYNYT